MYHNTMADIMVNGSPHREPWKRVRVATGLATLLRDELLDVQYKHSWQLSLPYRPHGNKQDKQCQHWKMHRSRRYVRCKLAQLFGLSEVYLDPVLGSLGTICSHQLKLPQTYASLRHTFALLYW